MLIENAFGDGPNIEEGAFSIATGISECLSPLLGKLKKLHYKLIVDYPILLYLE